MFIMLGFFAVFINGAFQSNSKMVRHSSLNTCMCYLTVLQKFLEFIYVYM